jgi:hypothetical protein
VGGKMKNQYYKKTIEKLLKIQEECQRSVLKQKQGKQKCLFKMATIKMRKQIKKAVKK